MVWQLQSSNGPVEDANTSEDEDHAINDSISQKFPFQQKSGHCLYEMHQRPFVVVCVLLLCDPAINLSVNLIKNEMAIGFLWATLYMKPRGLKQTTSQIHLRPLSIN
jgi:hypothetical protein